MDIHIDSASDVPIHRQLTEQIVFLIVTGSLKPGEFLPSVRQLARTLKIHHNTVSSAYQDLVRRRWLERRRGSRLAVIPQETSVQARSLDDLINATIRMARDSGHTMQALRERVRERLLAASPDHLLVVEEDEGLRSLLQEEIRGLSDWPVEGCGRADLAARPGLAIGALAAAAQHAAALVDALLPKDRPCIALGFARADEHLAAIRALRNPSVIAVVSGSELFLEVARGVLAPALGQRHAIREILVARDSCSSAASADLVFCDSIARPKFRLRRAVHYRLISPESLGYLETAVKSYRQP